MVDAMAASKLVQIVVSSVLLLAGCTYIAGVANYVNGECPGGRCADAGGTITSDAADDGDGAINLDGDSDIDGALPVSDAPPGACDGTNIDLNENTVDGCECNKATGQ